MNDRTHIVTAAVELAELGLTRALQRYASSKAACLDMFGSLSILVVQPDDYKILANASWEVYTARRHLGAVQARERASRCAAIGALS